MANCTNSKVMIINIRYVLLIIKLKGLFEYFIKTILKIATNASLKYQFSKLYNTL